MGAWWARFRVGFEPVLMVHLIVPRPRFGHAISVEQKAITGLKVIALRCYS